MGLATHEGHGRPQKHTHHGHGSGAAGVKPYDWRKVQGPRCRLCEILLDVPCTHPDCGGHRNERVGDVCRYCATDARGATHFVRAVATLLFSSLGDIGHGED